MKTLFRIAFPALLMSAGGSYWQSNLPACPSSGYFHNCFVIEALTYGEKYVGEFKNGKRNGQGTFTRRAVQSETKNQQTPWENTSLSGDFYFKVAR